MKVALVSCAKKKRFGCHAAKDLYTSALFKLTFQYASKNYDRVFILSAHYGLLDPNESVQTYDKTLRDMSGAQRRKWASDVLLQICLYIPREAEIHYFCGELYRKYLIGRLGRVEAVPLQGMRIGKQLQWYKNNLDRE